MDLKKASRISFVIASMAVATCSLAADNGVPNMPDLKLSSKNLKQRDRHRHREEEIGFDTESRKRFPFFFSLGFFTPNFDDPSISKTSGGEAAFGYRFPMDAADIRVSIRSQAFSLDDSFGNHADATVSMLGFDALFRAQQFYAGPGIAFGSVSGFENGFAFSGSDATVFSLTAGYDFTPRIFVEARWQTADVDAYKGYSFSVGYRF